MKIMKTTYTDGFNVTKSLRSIIEDAMNPNEHRCVCSFCVYLTVLLWIKDTYGDDLYKTLTDTEDLR